MLRLFFGFAFIAVPLMAQAQAGATKYEQIKDFLSQTAVQFAQNTRIVEVGLSDSGDKILALQIGSGPTHHMVVAAHHGNEYGSTAVATAFATALAANPIADQTVFVIPVLNIHGYNTGNREEKGQGGGWHDPNRDYPSPCGTDGPFRLKSTASLAKFINDQNIIASATLHTYWPAVTYPWGYSTNDTGTLYDSLFIQLAQAAIIDSHYTIGNTTEVIYPADGTFEDYAFEQHGIWSLLFELGNTHNPSQTQMVQWGKVNAAGLRRMFEVAPKARAANHTFAGECNHHLKTLDLHNE